MARLSSLQKAERVLRFVLSLRNPKISGVLIAHGFGPKDLDEVWTLFRAAAPVSFDIPQPAERVGVETGQQIRAWQRRWQPVITASLSRHLPDVAAAWRARLKQMRPWHPVMWALRFQTFYANLSSSAPGEAIRHGQEAIKLLAERGLTPEVVGDLSALITKFTSPDFDITAPERQQQLPGATPDIEEAIDRLWAWYLEWSQVARSRIDDGRVLRQAGFRSGDRRSKPVRRKAGSAAPR
jgi:hypothetical protein